MWDKCRDTEDFWKPSYDSLHKEERCEKKKKKRRPKRTWRGAVVIDVSVLLEEQGDRDRWRVVVNKSREI